jgi:DNA polymerase/3'-5' exonuclease PolX
MSAGQRISLEAAAGLANDLIESLQPYCHRIEVAGSIRRQRPTIGDIELVLVPKIEVHDYDLFGEPLTTRNLLVTKLNRMVEQAILDRRVDQKGRHCWGNRHQRAVYRGVPVEFFAVLPPAQWGVLFAIRTGSADFQSPIHDFRSHGRPHAARDESPGRSSLA